MSDAVIKEKTGCTWERWVNALDYYGAAEMSHRDIATLIRHEIQEDAELVDTNRSRRLRADQRAPRARSAARRHVRRHEIQNVQRSRIRALRCVDGRRARKRWLNGANVKVRTATAPKTMRLDWTDGSIIAVGFTSKGKSKSAVALEHSKLPDREAVKAIKEYWSERFDALAKVLANE